MTNEELTEALMHLFEVGAVNVSYDENLEPLFQITEKGEEIMAQWKGTE